MPSLTPESEDALTLAPASESSLAFEVATEAPLDLTRLVEAAGAAAYTIPGLLPSLLLSPATSGVYPRDNVFVPATVGPKMSPLADDTLTLTTISED